MSVVSTAIEHLSPDLLRDWFEALPLSAFVGDDVADPADFLPRLFGSETWLSPMVECAPLGSWISGWSVITRLPDTNAVFGFVLRERDDRTTIDSEWDSLSRGQRIGLLTVALSDPVWAAPDLPGLVQSVTQSDPDLWELGGYDLDQPGLLTDFDEVWVIRHALSVMDGAEADTSALLLGLSMTGERLAGLNWLVDAAANAVENLDQSHDEPEAAINAAAQALLGETLNGAEVERLGFGGVLMLHPRALWAREAERLMAQAQADGSLPERFYEKKASRPRSGSGSDANRDAAPRGTTEWSSARVKSFPIWAA